MTRPHAQAMLAPVLENRHLRLELDPDTGSVISLLNRHSALEAIEGDDVAAPPWRIQLTRLDPAIFEQRPTLRGRVWGKTEIVLYFLKHVVGGTWEWSYESFEWSYDETIADGRAIDLVWRRADGIVVEGRVELLTGRTDAEFTVRVRNGSTQCVLAVEYPVLDGIRPLSEDSRGDELAHSVDGGFLFRAPHRLFGDPEIIEAWKHRRIIETTDPEGHPDEGAAHGGLYRLRGYPNGFEGCPMQFLAYYCREVGGFYFASHDPHNTEKMFHFYSSSARRGLTCSVVHYSWQWERGADLAIEYPTLVGALNRGTWFEAADRYREWATGAGDGHPDWCRRGTLRTRVDVERRADGSSRTSDSTRSAFRSRVTSVPGTTRSTESPTRRSCTSLVTIGKAARYRSRRTRRYDCASCSRRTARRRSSSWRPYSASPLTVRR